MMIPKAAQREDGSPNGWIRTVNGQMLFDNATDPAVGLVKSWGGKGASKCHT